MTAVRTYIAAIDAVSEAAGKLCAWALVAVGFFVTYEVVMRYVFVAPTVWVDEISRIVQVFVVYLGAAWVLKTRDMVTIDVILKDPRSLARRLAESFGILVLFLFTGTAIYFGVGIWLKSTLAGHTTDTYLAVPKLITEAPVWLGCTLLAAQGLAELLRIWTVGIPADEAVDSEGSAG